MSENRDSSARVAGRTAVERSLLLLVEGDRNRELLVGQLDEQYDVQTPGDDPFETITFDLCLLDTASLDRFEGRLREAKAAAEPTFLPFVVLADAGSADVAATLDWVDEVVPRPVRKAELEARIENLVEQRRLSLELTRQKRRSERRFESLFESTPDPVVVASPNGTVTEVNEAFGEAFDVAVPAARGLDVTDLGFASPEAVERVLADAAVDGSATGIVEWEADGRDELVAELHAAVVSDEDEETECVGVFRDVTDREARRAELERQNERLEEFADTIAHDLRNPLSVARGELEGARATGEDVHFDATERSLDRMQQMIDELLRLAKQGQAVLDPSPVSVEAIVVQAWRHVQAPTASIELDIDRSTVVEADDQRLSELLENLFRNAIEHAGESVTVSVGELPDERGFFVADDGPGISPDRREQVFEAGYTDAEDGTGFGLSIVKQIVDGHGWRVSITEGDHGGARFEVRFD